MRGGGVCCLEAVEEHVVTAAVGLAVDRVVGKVVAAREGAHLRGAEVVGAAAAVEAPVRAEVVVVCCYVACTAPFRAWKLVNAQNKIIVSTIYKSLTSIQHALYTSIQLLKTYTK